MHALSSPTNTYESKTIQRISSCYLWRLTRAEARLPLWKVAFLTELDLSVPHATPCRDNELRNSTECFHSLVCLPSPLSASFFHFTHFNPPSLLSFAFLSLLPLTYLNTEKTRAIFPTALITSFRCKMLEAESEVCIATYNVQQIMTIVLLHSTATHHPSDDSTKLVTLLSHLLHHTQSLPQHTPKPTNIP